VRSLEIDRSSRLVLAGVGILSIAGVAATLLTSLSPSPDQSTPLGVVTAYVRAVQAGDADRAWALTDQATVQPAIGEPPRPFLSRDDYRNQVRASRQPTTPRVRVLNNSQSGDTATIQLEVSHASGDPLTGATTEPVTLSLTRQADGWRITSDPFPGQVE
jgi:ketosteroid isomerase-like protein